MGKSTLIRRLLEDCPLPRWGFLTRRLQSDENGFHPIYIFPAGKDPTYTPENLIGECDSRVHNTRLEVFNTLGTEYIRQARPGGVIIMDELGFMESEAEAFTGAVLDALEGDIPVLAAVKNRPDVPFLRSVLSAEKAEVFYITPENREELYEKLLPRVRAWAECVTEEKP
ncbi:MAG: hypothetical protein IKT07_05335 [Oscillospiraceae bacterium]|nr:hypothetical protein [Oscillospiraceae bacterium]